jgi:hypothetical protein
MNTEKMTDQQKIDFCMNKIFNRSKEMLNDPEIYKIYQAQPSEKDAKDWIFWQALVTLYFTPKERQKLNN